MSRLTDAAAEEPRQARKGPRCGVARIKRTLEPDDIVFFDKLCQEARDNVRTYTSITRILNRIGITYSANSLGKHIRGECTCDREQSV